MVSEFDTIIVGAGPAGNTVAYFLSLAGKRVLVLEKERLPRYKACGGALSPKVLKQFHFSFDPVIDHRVSQVSFAFGNKFATTPIAAGDITSGRLAAEAILASSLSNMQGKSIRRSAAATYGRGTWPPSFTGFRACASGLA
jgi:flavin-dependent dehydrogenase